MSVHDDCEIHGPYFHHGRWLVGMHYFDGRTTTMPYSRYLMEEHIGRKLDSDEHVHHIDGDRENNDISNLEVISKEDHIKYHSDEMRSEPQEFTCPRCGKKFELSGDKLRNAKSNSKRGHKGPFCSRSCAAQYAASRKRIDGQ